MSTNKTIYQKIFDAKKEIGVISKDSKNPFFKSSYLSLNGLINAVESVLEKHELLLIQPIEDGKVKTIIIDISDGERVLSEMQLPTINDPQKVGSAITYWRRYTLQSLLGLDATDDDGNQATKAVKTKPILTPNSTKWEAAKKSKMTYEQITKYYMITKEHFKLLSE